MITEDLYRSIPFWGVVTCLLAVWFPCQSRAQAPAPGEPAPLTLTECIRRVVNYNETIQTRTLEWLATQKKVKAAKGIFEPDIVASMERDDNNAKNTAVQIVSLGTLTFDQRNSLYNAGVEFLAPTGAKLRFGYSLEDMRNNLQSRVGIDREFQAFAGVNVTQPLLKNGGYDVTMANIRLAAGDSEIAFQEYRRQMSLMVARAEAAYWDLYYAQAQSQIRSDSVQVAEKLLTDSRLRLKTGKGSDLDVLQAEAGVAFRQARLKDTQQKQVEAMNRLTALISGSSSSANTLVRAVDKPAPKPVDLSFADCMREALATNPDYLSQMQQVSQEKIKVAYAQNQAWPQLDLKGSYGLNGLGSSIAASADDLEKRSFEAWTVGFELRIPLSGTGIKGRNELEAAKLRRRGALVLLKSVEVELANAMDTSIRRIINSQSSAANYQKVVDYNQRLLATELARMDVGKTDSRKVLEAEDYLSEVKSTALQALVDYQKAVVEWELIRGAKLRLRNLEFTKSQLESRTYAILRSAPLVQPAPSFPAGKP